MSTFVRYINIMFFLGVLTGLICVYSPFLPLRTLEIKQKYNLGNIVIDFFLYLFPPVNSDVLESTKVLSELGAISEERVDPFDTYKTFLRIPAIKVRGQVFAGDSPVILNKGFWHYPGTGDFRNGGNIVIIGHRYLKLPPAQDTFYNLDKINIGDFIYLENALGRWSYVVVQKRVVSRFATSVLYTKNNGLTLITCHPLWSSENRLIIFAKKVNDGIQIR